MKCPTCGEETKGRDHNERGLRCTSCWALLPVELPKPPKPRSKRVRKPASK
jgi:hypothetical protein